MMYAEWLTLPGRFLDWFVEGDVEMCAGCGARKEWVGYAGFAGVECSFEPWVISSGVAVSQWITKVHQRTRMMLSACF